ncbi:MAG: YjbH domain-containing protein [Candidatus Zixiibacteriota bacterium]
MLRSTMVAVCTMFALSATVRAQDPEEMEPASHTLFDIAPRQLVDMPTAGTLPRGDFQIGLRLYSGGGAMGNTDIGLSNRFQLGISFGGTEIVSAQDPQWNPHIGFSLKFRVIDELEYFPAIAVGFTDQGYGVFREDYDRYTYKSRGFYAVASRNFYFYRWTSGWHFGINRSLEDEIDGDSDFNLFGGLDATFNYNLALLLEYDAALNDDRGEYPQVSGKGRGYLNLSVKWLFAENLELEVLFKDMLVNRRESSTITREVRMMYIDHF